MALLQSFVFNELSSPTTLGKFQQSRPLRQGQHLPKSGWLKTGALVPRLITKTKARAAADTATQSLVDLYMQIGPKL